METFCHFCLHMSPVKAPNPTFSQSKWDSVVLYFIDSPSGSRLRILSSSVRQSSLLHVSATNKNSAHQSITHAEWPKPEVVYSEYNCSVSVNFSIKDCTRSYLTHFWVVLSGCQTHWCCHSWWQSSPSSTLTLHWPSGYIEKTRQFKVRL